MARANNNKSFGIYSRLRLYPTVIDEDKKTVRFGMKNEGFFNELRAASIFTESSVYTIPSKYEFRPDLVSYEQYGTPNLWWVIIGFNHIFHPLKEFTTGRKIRIPDMETIDGLLL